VDDVLGTHLVLLLLDQHHLLVRTLLLLGLLLFGHEGVHALGVELLERVVGLPAEPLVLDQLLVSGLLGGLQVLRHMVDLDDVVVQSALVVSANSRVLPSALGLWLLEQFLHGLHSQQFGMVLFVNDFFGDTAFGPHAGRDGLRVAVHAAGGLLERFVHVQQVE